MLTSSSTDEFGNHGEAPPAKTGESEAIQCLAQANGGASPCLDDVMASPSLTPITPVAKLIDGYLAEIATDINLKLPKFQSLASAVPEYARPLDAGRYRAIDIYLKAHSCLSEAEREQLCRLMDCQKLSLEVCTHAAQNERLPPRVVEQVLFLEQLQLRTSIAGCLLVSDNLKGSRPLRCGIATSGEDGGWATAVPTPAQIADGLLIRACEVTSPTYLRIVKAQISVLNTFSCYLLGKFQMSPGVELLRSMYSTGAADSIKDIGRAGPMENTRGG